MTLHDAIIQVLEHFQTPMKPAQIADQINASRLYVKNDSTDVTGSQIWARVNKYPDLFKIEGEEIWLQDRTVLIYQVFATQLIKLLQNTIAGNDKIRDMVACFLILVYHTNPFVGFNKHRQREAKKTLLFAFEELCREKPLLKDKFSTVLDFIERGMSEYEAEQIADLISGFLFREHNHPSSKKFGSFLNDWINTYSWKSNLRGVEFSTPKVLAKLMCSFYNLENNSIVFDPFAGRTSLLFNLIQTQGDHINKVIAGDINDNSYEMGSINLFFSGFKNFEYQRKNAFTDWHENVSADFFISTPPFGVKVERVIDFNFNREFQSSDSAINAIQLALYYTNNSGKIVLVLPESILFSSTHAHKFIRHKLINEDLLHGIILLPKGLFKPYSSVSSVLLLINKSRVSKSTGVFIYDASKISTSDFDSEINMVSSAFQEEMTITQKARWVEKEEFENSDFDLSVKRYLFQLQETSGLNTLKELTDSSFVGNNISADNINNKEGLPYIQVGNLIDGEGLGTISRENVRSFISDTELNTSPIKKITAGSVLLAKVGTKLKPTLFEDNFPAAASSNIIVLKPVPGILPEYLISQFQSEDVIKQVEIIRRYNAIPNFSLKELLNIKIKKLSFEEQQKYVAVYYSRKATDIKKAETRGNENELYNLISRIKHEIKQPISSIGIDISVLKEYLTQKEKSREFVSLSDLAVPALEGQSKQDIERTKVFYIFDRIITSISEAQVTLKKAEETLNIRKDSLKPEEFEIKSFIESAVISHYTNRNFLIQLEGKEQIITADKYQLKVLFNHLIDNAIKYGFVEGKPKEQSIIRFELKKDSGFLEIDVRNNGRPFSTGFNKALFETKGQTADRNNGSGFGGYHIKQIVENHKGELQIASEEEVRFTDFKVQFKIFLPLNY